MTPEDKRFLEEDVWTVISPEEDMETAHKAGRSAEKRDYRARKKAGKVTPRVSFAEEHKTLVKIIFYPDTAGLDYERVVKTFPIPSKNNRLQEVESAIDELKADLSALLKKKKGEHWGYNGTR